MLTISRAAATSMGKHKCKRYLCHCSRQLLKVIVSSSYYSRGWISIDLLLLLLLASLLFLWCMFAMDICLSSLFLTSWGEEYCIKYYHFYCLLLPISPFHFPFTSSPPALLGSLIFNTAVCISSPSSRWSSLLLPCLLAAAASLFLFLRPLRSSL
jgi:hypothetical protein